MIKIVKLQKGLITRPNGNDIDRWTSNESAFIKKEEVVTLDKEVILLNIKMQK